MQKNSHGDGETQETLRAVKGSGHQRGRGQVTVGGDKRVRPELSYCVP